MINLFKVIKILTSFRSKISLIIGNFIKSLSFRAIVEVGAYFVNSGYFADNKRVNGNKTKKSGFAMLFSVLISSLLVVIGLSIFNITLKELVISTSGRESQVAFYAANSGMECALYWDLKGNGLRSAFASTTGDIASAKSVLAFCNEVRVNSAITSVTTNFSFGVTSNPNGPCVSVEISKNPGYPDPNRMTTTIESRGKNICGSSGRKVERGLKATIITEIATVSTVSFYKPFSGGNCTSYCQSIGGSCVSENPWSSGICPYYPGGWNRGNADGANTTWCHTQKSEWGNPGGDLTSCNGNVTSGVSDRSVICGCQN